MPKSVSVREFQLHANRYIKHGLPIVLTVYNRPVAVVTRYTPLPGDTHVTTPPIVDRRDNLDRIEHVDNNVKTIQTTPPSDHHVTTPPPIAHGDNPNTKPVSNSTVATPQIPTPGDIGVTTPPHLDASDAPRENTSKDSIGTPQRGGGSDLHVPTHIYKEKRENNILNINTGNTLQPNSIEHGNMEPIPLNVEIPENAKTAQTYCGEVFERREQTCVRTSYEDADGTVIWTKWLCVACLQTIRGKVARYGGKLRYDIG